MPFFRLRGVLSAVGLFAAVTPASSHAVLDHPEARQGAAYRAVLQITHGCAGSATTSVSVTIPEGLVGARPLAKPGWIISTRRGPYTKTYPSMHGSAREGVKEITWSGNRLPDDEFDEFTFSVHVAADLPAGSTVYLPTVQTCEAGVADWVEVAKAGDDPHKLARPAPGLRILAGAASDATSSVTVGALTIERPTLRATPPSAEVAGGYVHVTNTGTTPDRLVSGTIPMAAEGAVHRMAMQGDVMTMRPVEGGLEIAPGQSVDLRPGGPHLMFSGLKTPLKAGETVKGSLTFAKAGTVAVTFQVVGLGAPAPAMGSMDH